MFAWMIGLFYENHSIWSENGSEEVKDNLENEKFVSFI